MNLSKSSKIVIFEALVSFLLIYFNWIGCTNNISNSNNINLIQGILNFALIFVLLFVTSFEYFSTFNPIITLLLYIFNQIDWKRVILIRLSYYFTDNYLVHFLRSVSCSFSNTFLFLLTTTAKLKHNRSFQFFGNLIQMKPRRKQKNTFKVK